MKEEPCRHLGLVVYCTGLQEQSRLIADGFAPAVEELRSTGLSLFWFDRFDARGPHVFAVFTVPPGSVGPARELLQQRLEGYLAHSPSRETITPEELDARHQVCRGKALCVIDTWPGLAENNSFFFCDHPTDGYPFSLAREAQERRRLREILDDLTGWVVSQLGRSPEAPPTGAAVQWLADLTQALLRSCSEPSSYWAYHAATVIPGLRLPPDPREAVEALTRALGPQNNDSFAPLWKRSETAPPAWPGLPRLIDLALEAGEPGKSPSPRLLREIVHTTLKQLGIPIRQQRPLLLFSLKQSLGA